MQISTCWVKTGVDQIKVRYLLVIHDVFVSRICTERMQMTLTPFSATFKLIIYHPLPTEFSALHIIGRWGLGVKDERNPQRKTHFEV